MKTNRALTLAINRLTEINVPAGAEVVQVMNGTGPAWALAEPKQYLAEWDSIGRHDVTHYYVWVPADAVDSR